MTDRIEAATAGLADVIADIGRMDCDDFLTFCRKTHTNPQRIMDMIEDDADCAQRTDADTAQLDRATQGLADVIAELDEMDPVDAFAEEIEALARNVEDTLGIDPDRRRIVAATLRMARIQLTDVDDRSAHTMAQVITDDWII